MDRLQGDGGTCSVKEAQGQSGAPGRELMAKVAFLSPLIKQNGHRIEMQIEQGR